MPDFLDLPSYLEWANTRAAEMLGQTPTEQGQRIFAHLLAAETTWAERILQQPPGCPLRPEWDREQCLAQLQHTVGLYQQIVQLRQVGDLVVYHNSKGEKFQNTVEEILLHVFAHGAYHRGQISLAVHSAGGEIIDTDYILFKRQ